MLSISNGLSSAEGIGRLHLASTTHTAQLKPWLDSQAVLGPDPPPRAHLTRITRHSCAKVRVKWPRDGAPRVKVEPDDTT